MTFSHRTFGYTPQFPAAWAFPLSILMTWQWAFPRASDPRENKQGRSYSAFCDLAWSHVPPVFSQSHRPTLRQCGRGLHKSMDTRRWGSLQPSWRLAVTGRLSPQRLRDLLADCRYMRGLLYRRGRLILCGFQEQNLSQAAEISLRFHLYYFIFDGSEIFQQNIRCLFLNQYGLEKL